MDHVDVIRQSRNHEAFALLLRFREVQPVSKILLLLITFASPIAAMAQGPGCSEQTIRDAVQNHTYKPSDDEFFWSANYEKPLIGRDEHEKAAKSRKPKRQERIESLQNTPNGSFFLPFFLK